MVSSSFLRHYDETKTLLKSQHQICAISADGEHGNERRIVDALSLILKNLDQHIENRSGVAWVANPVNPAENFADKWEGEPKKTECFFDWLEAARRDFGTYLRVSQFKQMPNELEEAFGSALVKRVVASAVGAPAIIGLAGTSSRVDAAVRDVAGIREACVDMLGIKNDPKLIMRYLRVLAGPWPKGHWLCPCGSNRRIRHCHRDALSVLHEKIRPFIARRLLNKLKAKTPRRRKTAI